MFTFGSKSNEQLATVDEKLQRVMRLAIQKSTIDWSILEGVRTLERQYNLYAKGRTAAELRAAGVPARIIAQPSEHKVTWTLKSKHFPPAGSTIGRAVDVGVAPYNPNAPISQYVKIKEFVFAAAAELGIKIRWGGDWDQDGKTEHGEDDFGHFELA
jgi:peptidoglycan L-alanyl-D-glutamate endopeptidase CwlK